MNRTSIARALQSAMTTGALFAILAASAGPSIAQDTLPSEDTFELRYTWVNPTTSVFGFVTGPEDGAAAEAGAWVAWLMRSDGNGGFGHKMTGRCIGMSRQDAANGYTMIAGNCVYTDTDGDQLFESYDGLTATWTGGTG
ncbi:MAG: hypothetical protein ACTSWI_03045, partial [Alphaproteobacteria bacterium]